MTVKELKKQLDCMPDNLEVFITADLEGIDVNPVSSIDTFYYSNYSQSISEESEVTEQQIITGEYVPVVVLWL